MDFECDDGGGDEMPLDSDDFFRQNNLNSQQNFIEERSEPPPLHESVYFVS